MEGDESVTSIIGTGLSQFCSGLYQDCGLPLPEGIQGDEDINYSAWLENIWNDLEVILNRIVYGLNTRQVTVQQAQRGGSMGGASDAFHELQSVDTLYFIEPPPAAAELDLMSQTLKSACGMDSPFTYVNDGEEEATTNQGAHQPERPENRQPHRVWNMLLPARHDAGRTHAADYIERSMKSAEDSSGATYYVVQTAGSGKTHSIVTLSKKYYALYLSFRTKVEPGMSPVMMLWYHILGESPSVFSAGSKSPLRIARRMFQILMVAHKRLLDAFLRTMNSQTNKVIRENFAQAKWPELWFNFHTSHMGQSLLLCLLAWAYDQDITELERQPEVPQLICALDDVAALLSQDIWMKHVEIKEYFYRQPRDLGRETLYTTLCSEALQCADYAVVMGSSTHITDHLQTEDENEEEDEDTGRRHKHKHKSKLKVCPSHLVLFRTVLSEEDVAAVLADERFVIQKSDDSKAFAQLCRFLAGSPVWVSVFLENIKHNVAINGLRLDQGRGKAGAKERNPAKLVTETAVEAVVKFASHMVLRPDMWKRNSTQARSIEWCHRAAVAGFFGALVNMAHMVPQAMRAMLCSENMAWLLPAGEAGGPGYGLADPQILGELKGLTIGLNSDWPIRMAMMQHMYNEAKLRAPRDKRPRDEPSPSRMLEVLVE